MASISVIGGGRWARTIVSVLAAIPETPGPIVLHTRHGGSDVRAWIAQQDLGSRVMAADGWPDYHTVRPFAVIVANRAGDHVSAAIPALIAQAAVLIEKPIAIGQDPVRQLCAEAAGSAVLAASHVVLFARYLDRFAAIIDAAGGARQMELIWQDGAGDVVRGEIKSYDPAISTFDDILPHVCPLLNRVQPGPFALVGMTVAVGGAQMVIQLKVGPVAARLCLGRDAGERCRRLTVQTGKGSFVLDFTREPGLILQPNGQVISGDPLWEHEPRPLRAMLSAFLVASGSRQLDERLSPEKALATAILADAVRAEYVPLQRRWLAVYGASSAGVGVEYAIREISLRDGENHLISTDGHRK